MRASGALTVVVAVQVSSIQGGVGVGLAVADLSDTAGVLTRNGVAFQRGTDALVVHPREACGAFLEFRSH